MKKIIITIEVDGEKVNVSTETKESEKEVIADSDNSCNDSISDYARVFDYSCTGWSTSSECNLTFLKNQQSYCNELLRTRGHLFLNEVYDALGIPRTKAGQIVGWVYDENNIASDNFVDFGLSEERCKNFVNGYENTVLLDFNVDGNILDRI